MKGQLRIYCVNDFDAGREPADDVPILAKRAGHPSYVGHSDFMKMLEIAWFQKENTESNIMAVLKRTHLFVNAKTFLYVRPASEEKQPVIGLPLDDKLDFLVEESRLKYDYRKGGSDLPNEFQENLKWEAKWMEAAMQGKKGDDLPRRVFILGPGLFSSPSTSLRQNASATREIYSYEKVSAGLAESIGAPSHLFPASVQTSLPASSTVIPQPAVQPPSVQPLRRQATFPNLRVSASEVIDISDSPVKTVPAGQKRLFEPTAVKQEVQEEEEKASKKLKTGKLFNESQDDVLEETESVLAAEVEHGDPLAKALEDEMDLLDAAADEDLVRLAEATAEE